MIDGGSLYWLDPARLSVLGSRTLTASYIWFGNGSLWAASDSPNGGVERIDPDHPGPRALGSRRHVDRILAPGSMAFRGRRPPRLSIPQPLARSRSSRSLRSRRMAAPQSRRQAGPTTYSDIDKLKRLLPTRRDRTCELADADPKLSAARGEPSDRTV